MSRVRLQAGGDRVLAVQARLSGPLHGFEKIIVEVAGASQPLELERRGDAVVAAGRFPVPGAELWWPHTHGAQPLYPVAARITRAGKEETVSLGRVGFRSITLDRGADGRGFGLVVNGVPVFCRGACWTPLDLHHLHAADAAYRAAVGQMQEAGMNMVRVGGTMSYEPAAFHDACDELGVLVWQDFMFANLDYPDTPDFLAGVRDEAMAVVDQIGGRPSLAVFCGSSELEQQAAMMGQPTEVWSTNPVLSALQETVAAEAPQVAWVASSPTGGTLPFHTDAGVTHYYGVGAYRRPFEDARYARVRFASECLAFSNIGSAESNPNAPEWKAGVPRDPGADWDFEAVRDHYVERLFGVNAAELRRTAPDRYLSLGRVTTGEVMSRVIAEWRRPASSCHGALIWFLRDLAPGAGWGVVSSDGTPKPAWWYLKRAFAPVTLLATDEGLNGWHLHAINDTATPLDATLHVAVYRDGKTPIARGSQVVAVPARSGVTISADAVLPGFLDLTCAYRFGPPGHNVLAARLVGSDGTMLGCAMHWPLGLPFEVDPDLRIQASARPCGNGIHLTLTADRAAPGVEIRSAGWVPEDNWFSLEPEAPHVITLRRRAADAGENLTVRSLNSVAIVVPVG